MRWPCREPRGEHWGQAECTVEPGLSPPRQVRIEPPPKRLELPDLHRFARVSQPPDLGLDLDGVASEIQDREQVLKETARVLKDSACSP